MRKRLDEEKVGSGEGLMRSSGVGWMERRMDEERDG